MAAASGVKRGGGGALARVRAVAFLPTFAPTKKWAADALIITEDSQCDCSAVSISSAKMEELGLQVGNTVVLRSLPQGRQCLGILLPSSASALGGRGDDRKVRLSSSMCRNLRLHASERVTVCRIDDLSACSTASFRAVNSVSGQLEASIGLECLQSFFAEGPPRPLVQGDVISVPQRGTQLEFEVVGLQPCVAGYVNKHTILHFKPGEVEPVAVPASPSRGLKRGKEPVFSPLLSVSVHSSSNQRLLEPVDVLRTSLVAGLKDKIRDAAVRWIASGQQASQVQVFIAAGCKIKLVHRRPGQTSGVNVSDVGTFEDPAFGPVVELLAVLFVRTHSVVAWGDPLTGGDTRELDELGRLSSSITRVYGNGRAMAALKENGGVVAWGDQSCGGRCGSASEDLDGGVVFIRSNPWAFAALKEGGAVISWGDARAGGDSSLVENQLKGGVIQIETNTCAFAALKGNGSVVTWGLVESGGDSNSVAKALSGGVTSIHGTDEAFVALKLSRITDSGPAICWGHPAAGGDPGAAAGLLASGIASVHGNRRAFAARRDDGSVVAWGDADYGGDLGLVADQLASGVTKVFGNGHAFAALMDDGSVVTWGNPQRGGDSSAVREQLSGGCNHVFCNAWAFVAFKAGGSLVTWGDPAHGGDSGSVAAELEQGIVNVFSNDWAFVALTDAGRLIAWGEPEAGGKLEAQEAQEAPVAQVFANERAFAALSCAGRVLAWGDPVSGGSTAAVAEQLAEVLELHAGEQAFAALRADGAVVCWGHRLYGAASTAPSGVREIHANGRVFVALKELSSYVI